VRWAPNIPIYVSVKGSRLRYISTGEGPALVLLHTLRTQLDLFGKIVPELSKKALSKAASKSFSTFWRFIRRRKNRPRGIR
jgi:hypothetical protein